MKLKNLMQKFLLAVVGIFLGSFGTILFHEFVLSEANISEVIKARIFYVFISLFSFAFACSAKIRCLTFLSCTEYFGKAGRRSVLAAILILVLTGPVENMGNNSEEVLNFTTCIKDMLWDIILAGKSLVLAPVQHVLSDIKQQESDPKSFNFSSVDDMLKNISFEIEDETEIKELQAESDYIDLEMGEPKRSSDLETHYVELPGHSDAEGEKIEKTYRKKLAYRCEDVFSQSTSRCHELFQAKYDECEETVTKVVSWLLCWPMKLTYICDILSMFVEDRVCDMSDVVEDGFGDNYIYSKSLLKKFKQSFKMKVNYFALPKMINLTQLKKNKAEVLAVFKEAKQNMEGFISLINQILAFTFILVTFSAFFYERRYLSTLSFDNTHVNSRFERIDRTRKRKGKTSLLPFLPMEKAKLTTICTLKLSDKERNSFLKRILIISLYALITGSIFLFDYIFTSLIQLVNRHANISLTQEGTHVLSIKVTGNGLLANILRDVIADFDVQNAVNTSYYTTSCLPNAAVLDKSYLQRVIVLLVALVILSFFEAHVRRFKHCIANFCFPQRAKHRTIWLYNDCLRRRRNKIEEMKNTALENANILIEKRDFISSVLSLGDRYPKCCGCLHSIQIGRKCLLCFRRKTAQGCSKCNHSYCSRCWKEADRKCIYCKEHGYSQFGFVQCENHHYEISRLNRRKETAFFTAVKKSKTEGILPSLRDIAKACLFQDIIFDIVIHRELHYAVINLKDSKENGPFAELGYGNRLQRNVGSQE